MDENGGARFNDCWLCKQLGCRSPLKADIRYLVLPVTFHSRSIRWIEAECVGWWEIYQWASPQGSASKKLH